MFRFGDKRTYLEQVALEQAVRSSLRKKQLKAVRLFDALESIATDRTSRLPDLDAMACRIEHARTKAVLQRVRDIVANRAERLQVQVGTLKADLLRGHVGDATE